MTERIEKDYGGNYSISSRLFYKRGYFNFRFAGIMDLATFSFDRYDGLLNYKHKDLDLTVKHESKKTD